VRFGVEPLRGDDGPQTPGKGRSFLVCCIGDGGLPKVPQQIIEQILGVCESSGTRGRTATLKIKYADFQQITRSYSVRGKIDGRMALEEICLALLKAQYPTTKGIRLLGVSISALSSVDTVATEQLPLGL
jgi:DNA polymerase IV